MSLEIHSDSTWLRYVLAVGLFFFGAFSVWAGVVGGRGARQARASWPQVPAKILRTGAQRSGNGYVAEVWYRYTIDGVEYECASIRAFAAVTSEGSALKDARRYQATQEVTAHVNPKDHAEAILEPTPQPFAAAFFVLSGAVFIAIGVWLLIAV